MLTSVPAEMAEELEVESHAPYLKVWAILAILTLVEYFYAMIFKDHFLLLVLGLVCLALVKAGMVGWYFMHLKFERKWVYLLIIPACVMAVFLTLMLYSRHGHETGRGGGRGGGLDRAGRRWLRRVARQLLVDEPSCRSCSRRPERPEDPAQGETLGRGMRVLHECLSSLPAGNFDRRLHRAALRGARAGRRAFPLRPAPRRPGPGATIAEPRGLPARRAVGPDHHRA